MEWLEVASIATALLDEEIADSEMQMQCFLHIQNNRSVPQPVPLLLSVALFREDHEKIVNYVEMLVRKSDSEFFKWMRVTKKTFHFLIDEMSKTARFSSTPQLHAGQPRTSSATALAVTLWYLGNLSSQREIAERFHISQGHLSCLVKAVVDFLCDNAETVIRWPSLSEMNDTENAFAELANFPGVLGAIDGCHIRILAPDYCQSDYVDRNQNHSVNLMAVCDANKRFTYCFAGFPGSVHDQRVLANSNLASKFDNSTQDHFDNSTQDHFPSSHYHIIGDSAFQLQKHVMVPYKDTGNLTAREITYNRKLSQTRRVIENAFGFLKGRFRRLKYLECKLSRVPSNIIACCVLHNLTVCDQTEMELLLNDADCDVPGECDVPAPGTSRDVGTAKQKRDHIADMLLHQ